MVDVVEEVLADHFDLALVHEDRRFDALAPLLLVASAGRPSALFQLGVEFLTLAMLLELLFDELVDNVDGLAEGVPGGVSQRVVVGLARVPLLHEFLRFVELSALWVDAESDEGIPGRLDSLAFL